MCYKVVRRFQDQYKYDLVLHSFLTSRTVTRLDPKLQQWVFTYTMETPATAPYKSYLFAFDSLDHAKTFGNRHSKGFFVVIACDIRGQEIYKPVDVLRAKDVANFETFWDNMQVKVAVDGTKYLTQSTRKTIKDLEDQRKKFIADGTICVKSLIPISIAYDTANTWVDYEYPPGSGGSGGSGVSGLESFDVGALGKGKISQSPDRNGRFIPKLIQGAIDFFNIFDEI